MAGASGPLGEVVRYPSVPSSADLWSPTWYPVLATTLATGSDMTHVGSQRVWVRAFIEGGAIDTPSTSRLRFRAEVGDLLLGSANAPTAILNFGRFYVLDLGVIRLDKAPVGNHRWQGYVEAMNATGNESVSIDKLWVIPVQEGAGALRALDPLQLYDGLTVSDAVVFANQDAELRSDGLWRLSRSGAGYGPLLYSAHRGLCRSFRRPGWSSGRWRSSSRRRAARSPDETVIAERRGRSAHGQRRVSAKLFVRSVKGFSA